ncbi:hypothetical protein [Inconstantimicrobium mannanitabidum]|uniref:Uncharacterized protein n=1 Tax=Inconstantimicrobium mannanitabidum TaxID=1604901 RepID=A0ACB5RF32_9CLOT|nr:hypothetical protein [Clostridium sp. TW13]GKX67746.1 hypothetical protein rsdtw13_30040 [Clostridium sp. TW13]
MRKRTKRTLGLATILACSLSVTAFGFTADKYKIGAVAGYCYCGLYGYQHAIEAIRYEKEAGRRTEGSAKIGTAYSGHHGRIYAQIGDCVGKSVEITGPGWSLTTPFDIWGRYPVTEIHSYTPY